MAKRMPDGWGNRLLSLRIRPLALVCALFGIIALGVMKINSVSDSIEGLQVKVTDLRIERDQQYKALRNLEEELKIVNSNDYIIAKARQNHGFMMPNELLFVVANPEALYGESDAPVEMAVLTSDQVNEAETEETP